ncbi:UNVERIFIED_CONTAM: hypothetical protein Sangu_1654500 [Sesamum angustifolium]|uniref:Uncharacterized protein n=1 Tax=Sesamum angustifolium TaxID=2727405 RepID=A0AAW2MK64_9LAMI
MLAGQAMKRIPRIKFPQRHLNSSGITRQIEEISARDDVHKNDDLVQKFFSRSPSSMSVEGKASDQPKRTPVSQEEIETIMFSDFFNSLFGYLMRIGCAFAT